MEHPDPVSAPVGLAGRIGTHASFDMDTGGLPSGHRGPHLAAASGPPGFDEGDADGPVARDAPSPGPSPVDTAPGWIGGRPRASMNRASERGRS
jgi:hypothetical protein